MPEPVRSSAYRWLLLVLLAAPLLSTGTCLALAEDSLITGLIDGLTAVAIDCASG